DHLIGSLHLLGLYIVVSGYFLYNRNDLLIDLLDGIIFSKVYGSGSSAFKLQTVSKESFSLGLVESHNAKSDHHDGYGQGKEIFLYPVHSHHGDRTWHYGIQPVPGKRILC